MNEFVHDTLRVTVGNVNLRNELHGDENVLAIDIKVWIAPGESGEQWESVLGCLYGIEPEKTDEQAIEDLGRFKQLPFSRSYENHTCKFWAGTNMLARIDNAKFNNFRMDPATDKNDDRITFRIQVEATGDIVKTLAELLGLGVRLEILGPPQAEMFQDGDDPIESGDNQGNKAKKKVKS